MTTPPYILARDPEALLRAFHLLSGAATEPVGLDEAAQHTGLDDDDADDYARLLEADRLIERTGPTSSVYRVTSRGLTIVI